MIAIIEGLFQAERSGSSCLRPRRGRRRYLLPTRWHGPLAGKAPITMAKKRWRGERPSQPDHRQVRMLLDDLGGLHVHLATRPGLPEWQHPSQAARLIADHAQIEPGQRVLVCPCGNGGLGVWAASQTDPRCITLLDTNSIAVEAAERSMAANGCGGARVEAGLPSASAEPYDVALMQLPKGRELARLLFLHVFDTLQEGGRLYLAGPNRGGIKSAIKDCAALFGPVTLLSYKGGNRIASFSRGPGLQGSLPEIYRVPGMADGTYRQFQIELRGRAFHVCTRPGVFSRRGLDAGTRLLLDALDVRVSDTVLDVGCGYGAIGIFAASAAVGGRATLVDVDLLACECARASLALNGVENAEVVMGDGLAAVPGRRFTLIVSNPPFHIGRATTSAVAETFIHQAYQALRPRGRLVVVANRFLPYDRLMGRVFGSVAAVAETARYHVLRSDKRLRRRSRGEAKHVKDGGQAGEAGW